MGRFNPFSSDPRNIFKETDKMNLLSGGVLLGFWGEATMIGLGKAISFPFCVVLFESGGF